MGIVAGKQQQSIHAPSAYRRDEGGLPRFLVPRHAEQHDRRIGHFAIDPDAGQVEGRKRRRDPAAGMVVYDGGKKRSG